MDPQLQAIIESVTGLAELPAELAPEVARAVKSELTRTVKAGMTPYGEAWKPKQDGDRALVNAMDEVHVGVYKGNVFVRLTGPEARHHNGTARGGVKRVIIPNTPSVPPAMASAIESALVRHFDKAVSDG